MGQSLFTKVTHKKAVSCPSTELTNGLRASFLSGIHSILTYNLLVVESKPPHFSILMISLLHLLKTKRKNIPSMDTSVDTANGQDQKLKMFIKRESFWIPSSSYVHKCSPVMLSKQDKCSFVHVNFVVRK